MSGSDPLWRAMALLRPRLPRLLVATALGVASLGSALALAATAAWLITRAAQMPPVLDLSVAVVAVRAFGISRGVLHYCERLVSHDEALHAAGTARVQTYRLLAHGTEPVAVAMPGGELAGRVGSDVDELADVLVRAVLPIAVAAVLSVAAVGVIAVISPAAAGVLALCLLVAGVVAPWLSARAAAGAEELARAEHAERDVAAVLALAQAPAMAQSKAEFDALRDELRKLRDEVAALAPKRFMAWPGEPLAAQQSFRLELGRQHMALQAARALSREVVARLSERMAAGQALTPDDWSMARAGMAYVTEAAAAITQAQQAGIRVVMISGDNRGAALAMGRRLGLADDEVMADVLPGDKAARVAALKGGGQHVVAMVGDGVNDAPALAAADVGMAMGTGTDVAMHAAGVTLMRGDVALVAAALDVSDRTVAKIRQNLFWAFAYNVAGIPLAALGYLSPVVAGGAMALSSVSVMANALLLRRWRAQRPRTTLSVPR